MGGALNLRPFQIFLLAIFAVLAILAVVLLSGFTPNNNSDENLLGSGILIWGTLDQRAVNVVIDELSKSNKAFSAVEYQQINERDFNDVLVSAIAEGRSPDLVLLPSSELVRQRNRLLAITYDTISERQFRDQFVEGAEIFARPDGVYALPVLVDPLMMYWNRDLFSSGGLVSAPASWEAVVAQAVPSLTKRDNNRTVLQSAVAFGETSNVRNAKEIMLMLALQSGSRMVYEDRGNYQIGLNQARTENALPPLEASVNFFSSFSNPNSQLYSWNRAQPLDRNAFVAEDLAVYFGFGSEQADIAAQNPNLNFDVAAVPQGAAASVKRTYGEFYGLAIVKASQNPQGAYFTASTLAAPANSVALASALGMAPTSRAALAAGTEDTFGQLMYSSALIARGWLDPSPSATDEIFQGMIENVTSGRANLFESVQTAIQQISLTF